jgi:hypothetical protein
MIIDEMNKLIEDCQREIAAYLPPESGTTEHQLLQGLVSRHDGCQAKDASARRQGWWPDRDYGDDDGNNPTSPPSNKALEPA